MQAVPLICDVRSVIDTEKARSSPTGTELVELPIERPYLKDYDAIGDNSPLGWPERFDIRNCGLIVFQGRVEVGAAAVAWNTPEIDLLEHRRDMAVLWDIRVRPKFQRRGIGRILFQHAAGWAAKKGCKTLRIETQQVNVAACQFYARMGCMIERIEPDAYRGEAEIADEIRIVWRVELDRGDRD